LWWVIDHFKILPTDPAFKELTAVQVALLIQMYNHDVKKKQPMVKGQVTESYSDPEFDTWLEQQSNTAWNEL
jgi:hypothetical protein